MVWIVAVVLLVTLAGFAQAHRSRCWLELRAALLDLLASATRRGVPLHALLVAAAAERTGRERNAILDLALRLELGRSLAEALEALPDRVLPRHVAGAVRAAEGTARLPDVLEAAASDAAESVAMRH
ncbi:MAG: type II secretion system F family protein, partial [Planctomycetota bacterium]